MIKIRHKGLSAALSFGLIVFSASIGALGQSNSDQNIQHNSASSDRNLKSVARINPSTLAMEFTLPIAIYPGRAGTPVPVSLNYSSKVWRLESWGSWYKPVSLNTVLTMTDVIPDFGRRTSAGWSSSMAPPRLEVKEEYYTDLGRPYTFLNAINLHQSAYNFATVTSLEVPVNCRVVHTYRACGYENGGVVCQYYHVLECIGTNGPYRYTHAEPGGTIPGEPGNPNGPPRYIKYVARVHVFMPDGSSHEFRKNDTIATYCTLDSNGNCTGGSYVKTGEYLSVDGSRMRLVIPEGGTADTILYMPDGSHYAFETDLSQDRLAKRFVDANGNHLTYSRNLVAGGRYEGRILDTMGRTLVDPLDQGEYPALSVGSQFVSVPGSPGQANRQYELKWDRLENVRSLAAPGQPLSYRGQDVCFINGGNVDDATHDDGETTGPEDADGPILFYSPESRTRVCSSMGGVTGRIFNPVVLAGLTLPNQTDYTFKYNQYGEITRITYPTGAVEEFDYGRVVPLGLEPNATYDQTNRGVTARRIYKQEGGVPEQTWQYSTSINPSTYPVSTSLPYVVTTIDPEGKMMERVLERTKTASYGFVNTASGMPIEERSYSKPDGSGVRRLVSRTLTEWISSPQLPFGYVNATRDTRVSRSTSVTIENGQALATLSESTYQDPAIHPGVPSDASYFARLNVVKTKSHHYRNIPLSLAESNSLSLSQVAAYFNTSTVATISETDYLYDENYKARGIGSLPIESRTLDPSDNAVLTKAQTKYDNLLPNIPTTYPGAYSMEIYSISGSLGCGLPSPNVCWIDPATVYRANPTTSIVWRKEGNSWIESIQTHNRYDIFGNVLITKDAVGNELATQFSGDHYYAYPTRVDKTGPDPLGVHGTSEGSFSTTTYDFQTGLPLTVSDEFGNTTKTEYNDSMLRPTKTYGLGSFVIPIAETFYDDAPPEPSVKVRKQLDAVNWAESTTFVDSLGRTTRTQSKDSQGDVFVKTTYDVMGRVSEVSNPYRESDTIVWSKTTYDDIGRVKETFAPPREGQPTGDSLGTTTYDISTAPSFIGLVVTTRDAALKNGRSITNALGQLIRIDEPDHTGNVGPLEQSTPNPGPSPSPTPDDPPPTCLDDCLTQSEYPSYSTVYEYNALGKMVEVTQGGQKRFFLYDNLGRLLRVRQPEQEINDDLDWNDPVTGNSDWTAAFTYDIAGNVLTARDANGVTITSTYDLAGRVKTRTYSGEIGQQTPAASYFYDGKEVPAQSPNYAKGNLSKVTNTISQTLYKTYDKYGRLTEMEQRTPLAAETIANATPHVSKYTYHPISGALIEEEYPSGRKVKTEFESDGDLARIYGSANASATERTYANSFSYTPEGAIEKLKLGNGLWEQARFNTRLQVTELALGHGPGGGELWKLGYEYGELNSGGAVDAVKNTGNIAKLTLSFNGLAHPFIQTFKYDSLYRLTEARETSNNSQTWKQTFGYDRFGNRTALTQDVSGQQLQINNLTLPTINPATNRFAANQGYLYDKNGNLKNDPVGGNRQFKFNGNNKQKEVRDQYGNLIGEYFYDGEGKRVKKRVYSAGVETEETVFVYSNGKLVTEFSTAPTVASPTTSYTVTDQLGSPRDIVNAWGQVTSRRDFMPFGEELAPSASNRTTGLKYGAADTVRQKFTGYQKDDETGLDFAEARMYENRHARFTAVDPLLASGQSANPQTFNRYIYVLNNPLVLVDPDGLQVGVHTGKVHINKATGHVGIFPGRVKKGFVPLTYNTSGTTTVRGVRHHITATPNHFTIGDRVDGSRFATSAVGTPLGNPTVKNFLGGFATGYADAKSGSAKGAFNFFAGMSNAITGQATLSLGNPFWSNPFEIGSYQFNSATEARFGIGTMAGLSIAPMVAAGPLFASGSSTLHVAPQTQVFRFSQTSVSRMFHPEGNFAGRSVLNVADDLRSGSLAVQDVPVGYVTRNGINLIDNHHSAIALQEAGIPMNQWNLVNRTGSPFFEASVTNKLANNRLTNTGTNTVRFNGCFYSCQ